MSDKKKISIVVLGNGDSLKKALITNIIEKDLSKLSQRNVQTNTEIYENDAYEFKCTPDLDTACEDIAEIIKQHPDMCLLVVEDGFSAEEVSQQIEKLQKITEKPTEEFRVVLPLSYKHPFRCYTMEQVTSEVRKLAKDRPGADPESTTKTPVENTEKKISIVVLVNGDSLKNALITNILGKDLSKKKSVLKETEIYENDIYEVTCTPDLDTACVDIGEIIKQHPDMCLLVVEDGFSAEEVSQQIEKLQKITEKPTEEFRVVLPLSYKHPFRCYTMEQVTSEVRKLAKDRPGADPESTTKTPVENTGGSITSDPDSEKNLKTGKLSATKVTLVLLGMSGTGKSASGNTILGEKKFTSRVSSNPVTTVCQEAETEIDGTRVRVIDTPDIFDDEIESSVKNKHVKRCKQLCQSGPCVYLLVMHVSRFTDGERNILKKLEEAFGSKVQEQTVILFTRGADLQHADMSFKDFLLISQPDLKEIVKKCGNRCVVFENRAPDSDQVEKLMQTVDKMLEEQQKQ